MDDSKAEMRTPDATVCGFAIYIDDFTDTFADGLGALVDNGFLALQIVPTPPGSKRQCGVVLNPKPTVNASLADLAAYVRTSADKMESAAGAAVNAMREVHPDWNYPI